MSGFARVVAALLVLSAACDRAVEVDRTTHATTLHLLEITRHRLESDAPPGGGIALVGNAYLAVTGGGEVYAFERDDGELRVRKLEQRVPMNREAFLEWTSVHRDRLLPFLETSFRTHDLLVVPEDDRVRLLVSHAHWREEEECYSLRVSTATTTPSALLEESTPLSWETFYETVPCLPWKTHGHGFNGQQAGGEMTSSPDGRRVLLTVGDFEFDGLNDTRTVSQEPDVPYGKLLSIDLDTRAVEVLATGLRNPQGVAFDPDGRLWTTEHGPQGGDELNLVEPGSNYGWPYVTYGVHYGRFDWPLSIRRSEHDGFAPPMFAWVPSVGAGDLLAHDGRGFSQWRGDLIVAALKTRELLRIRIRDGRVAYVEPIPVETRVRDMIEDRDGSLLLWTDDPDLRVVASLPLDEADARTLSPIERGRVLFSACRGCHGATPDAPDGLGPSLWSVVGRPVASREYPYSEALRSRGGAWSPDLLRDFLADPARFAPGTTMQFEGLRDPDDRASLVAYLSSLSG